MKYPADLISLVVNEITERKKKRDNAYASALKQAYLQNPELEKIDLSLAKMGSDVALAALSGNTDKIEMFAEESALLQKKKNFILESFGIKKPQPECKICEDTAYINGKLCECAKNLLSVKCIEKLNLKTNLSDYRFDNFDLSLYPDKPDKNGTVPRNVMKNVLEMAKNYCKTFGENSKSIIFMGGVGLGKTHLSLAIVGELAKNGVNAVYASAGNLFNEIEKEYFSYSGETQKYDEVLNTDLLLIDDLGTEFSTSFSQSVFYNIINTRLLHNLPTIISTNLTFGELEAKYTPRISSRFIGNYEMIKFFGNDIRVQKALKNK